jgi:hypothetical protein
MACSLNRSGKCGENGSFIKILSHPEFDYFMPIIKFGCLEADCQAECMEACSPRVLKLADKSLSIKLELNPKWQPVLFAPKENQ